MSSFSDMVNSDYDEPAYKAYKDGFKEGHNNALNKAVNLLFNLLHKGTITEEQFNLLQDQIRTLKE